MPLKWKLLSGTVYCAVQGTWLKRFNLKMKSQSLSIQMKTNYAAALSCGTVYYAVQNGFNYWVCRWNPKVGPSSEIYWVVLCCLPCCTRWYKLLSLWMKPLSVSLQMKSTAEYFPVVLFIMLYKVVLTFESVDEILKCGHSNESYWAVLSRGTVYYAVQGGFNFWVCGWTLSVSFKRKPLNRVVFCGVAYHVVPLWFGSGAFVSNDEMHAC